MPGNGTRTPDDERAPLRARRDKYGAVFCIPVLSRGPEFDTGGHTGLRWDLPQLTRAEIRPRQLIGSEISASWSRTIGQCPADRGFARKRHHSQTEERPAADVKHRFASRSAELGEAGIGTRKRDDGDMIFKDT